MWIIFNPTDQDLKYEINWAKWELKAGESKKFPNEVGEEMFNIHGFLQVLEKDQVAPKVAYKAPTKLNLVEEAEPMQVNRDRAIRHPSSNPKVRENMGFGTGMEETKEFNDSTAGLPPTIGEEISQGKLMKIDKDGVSWYGEGISVDNPLAKE